MKALKYILATVLLLFVFSSFSQVEITKSTEKTRIEGKIYYIHHVKQGETIYSLCKVYNVTQKELTTANPQLSQGLKAGQTIKIPFKDELKTETAKPKVATKQENKEIKKSEKPDTEQTANSAVKHRIKSGETLESIAKKYECTVEDILKCNLFLDKNSKLKKGQYLTVCPAKSEPLQPENVAENAPDVDSTVLQINEQNIDIECGENLYSGDMMNIVLMLPLKAAEINSNLEKNQRIAYEFIEFYEGFLLAADSLNSKNISINLTVFDVYDAQTLKDALNSPLFNEAQLVICHIPKNLMDTFAKSTSGRKVPAVLSFSHDKEDVAKNEYFIQAFAPISFQIEKLNKILCGVDENIVVIHDEITDTTDFVKFIKRLEDCGKTVKTYHYQLHGSHNENLQEMFNINGKNSITVLSSNKVFVTDVLSKLNELSISRKYDMTVYGQPQWKSFEETLNFDHIHNVNLSIIQSSFVDYKRDEVKNFISKYRYYYKGDPSRFSFHGYDLGIYFIDMLAKYGTNFMNCITNEEAATLLQTRFKFDRISPQGGLVNTESLLLRYTKEFNTAVE
ncbi:MAG: LysM peptidoglycan-binding domain-containing protein [Prevotellaceae bacterium]|jgi:LysM repeat protein|nr:LysM peptidoglycan-binding domain-containing protein [Prevotellaceae bacterium]